MNIKGFIASLPPYPRAQIQQLHFRKKLQNATIESEPDLSVIKKLVSCGDSVIDVGANFGLYTRFLSEAVGESGNVYSFEPTFDMCRVLRNNVDTLSLLNTQVFQMACSESVSELDFYIPRRNDGTLNYYEASLEKETIPGEYSSCRVPTTSLDLFADAHVLGTISFLKIDVEGHEIQVLKGARRTLTEQRPTIFLEVNESLTDGGHGSLVRALIEEYNYAIHIYDQGEIKPWKPGKNLVNYLLLPR